MYISGKECARARESVSADLDRELHELDHRRLQAHLRVCADCSDWAERVTATTTQLREALFEASRAATVELPRRGRISRVRSALAGAPVAAALAVGAVVLLGGAQHSRLMTGTPQRPTHRHFVGNNPSVGMDMYGRAPHYVFRPV